MSLLRKIRTAKLKSNKFFKKFIIFYAILKKGNYSSSLKQMKSKKIKILFKFFSILERLKMKFSLNQYKFEEKLLYILASVLTKFYKKKIEFNIINLKSIAFNSDIFTKILTLKSRSKRINPHKVMKFIFNKAIIPRTNRIKEKTPVRKRYFKELLIKTRQINKDILRINENYKYSSYISKCLNKVYSIYTNIDQRELYENIFNSIHYKNIGGIRLEIKGRLT
jgi:hypothetical protein